MTLNIIYITLFLFGTEVEFNMERRAVISSEFFSHKFSFIRIEPSLNPLTATHVFIQFCQTFLYKFVWRLVAWRMEVLEPWSSWVKGCMFLNVVCLLPVFTGITILNIVWFIVTSSLLFSNPITSIFEFIIFIFRGVFSFIISRILKHFFLPVFSKLFFFLKPVLF